jgi:hypothetical protein
MRKQADDRAEYERISKTRSADANFEPDLCTVVDEHDKSWKTLVCVLADRGVSPMKMLEDESKYIEFWASTYKPGQEASLDLLLPDGDAKETLKSRTEMIEDYDPATDEDLMYYLRETAELSYQIVKHFNHQDANLLDPFKEARSSYLKSENQTKSKLEQLHSYVRILELICA